MVLPGFKLSLKEEIRTVRERKSKGKKTLVAVVYLCKRRLAASCSYTRRDAACTRGLNRCHGISVMVEQEAQVPGPLPMREGAASKGVLPNFVEQSRQGRVELGGRFISSTGNRCPSRGDLVGADVGNLGESAS